MKRIMALCLVLTTLLGVCILTKATAIGAEAEADFAFLKAVGILDPSFSSDTTYVTRREAAMLLVRAANAHVTTPVQKFSDVEVGDPYAAEIAMAYDMGLISGFGDGTFHPKQSVTYNQMVKMLVVLLGYKDNAEALGGYPAGYQVIANQKDIAKGVTAKGEDPLLYTDMAVLMRSALLAPLAEGETYVDGFVEYAETGENILSAWHGIDYIKGEVTADYLITIAADRTVKDGEVAIAGKVVHAGATGAASLIGQKVEAFVDRDTETILYIEPHTTADAKTIGAADVISVDTGKLVYEDGENEKTETIAGAKLIKNGVLYDSFTAADMQFANGQFRLIYESGTIKYIIAESFVNKIVDYVDADASKVYFRDGSSLVIDTTSTSRKTVFLEASGFPSGLEHCYPWDIFSVMDGGEALKIVRSEKLLQGTVEEIPTDSITVDGKTFKFSAGYTENANLLQPELGMHADFYLDYTGCLAAIDTSFSKTGRYGILVGSLAKSGLDTQVQLKIYTQDAEMCGFEVAEHVRFNGYTKKEEEILAVGSPIFNGTNVIRQMVTFKCNVNGEISEINTARDFTANPDSEDRLSYFSRDIYIDENRRANGVSLTYNYEDSESFGRKYLARPATKIFVLPPEGSPDEDYKMTEYTSLPGGSENVALTYVTLFDIDMYYHIGAMTWEKKSTESLPSHPNDKLFVTKTYKGLDAEGADAFFIEGIGESGAEIKLQMESDMEAWFLKTFTDDTKDDPENFEVDTMNPSTWPSEIIRSGKTYRPDQIMFGRNKYKVPVTRVEPGDMLNYVALNGKASLIYIVARSAYAPETELWYDDVYYPMASISDNVHGAGGCYALTCGRVTNRISESFVMETKSRINGNTLIRAYRSGKVCVLFDTKKGTTQRISFAEMQVGDKVLVWNRTSDIVFVAVIR